MKKLVIAAATISCCIANAVPAKANILSKTIANANKFCSSVVHLNNTLKQLGGPRQLRCQGFPRLCRPQQLQRVHLQRAVQRQQKARH